VFQEVPDETSFAFVLSCCPGRCPGCHSAELQGDLGEELTCLGISTELGTNARFISCVLFLGGDNDIASLTKLIKYAKSLGYKTAVYSGLVKNPYLWELEELDYLKLGPWISSCGPLGSPLGNQHMWKKIDSTWVDITDSFA
jgi:anaerobic ribonucleoside-triphosphate reductase activating protein